MLRELDEMSEAFHYPHDLFTLLVDTIPLLCRSKKQVVLFLQGAGVEQDDLTEMVATVAASPSNVTKYEIVRNVLTKVNARGDNGLRARREIVKRVVEFESFETCWPEDQYKAKGLVASVRQAVDAKDAFTRMHNERDAERVRAQAERLAERAAANAKREKIAEISDRLNALFGMDDSPQKRGKLLEGVLNDLFRAFGILVCEDFRRKALDTALVVEQIDGVIELNGQLHLVEMKWLNGPVGMEEFMPHLGRLFMRSNVHGIFIATNGFASTVISECSVALSQRTMFFCSLREIVHLLQAQGELADLLRKKSQSAVLDKNPFIEILS